MLNIYNYAVVKKLARQGLSYIRIKKGYEFALKNPSEWDTEDLMTVIEQVEQPEVSETNNSRVMSSTLHSENHCSSSGVVQPQSWKIDERYQTIIIEFPSDINDTSEMLRYYQGKVHRGRPLDVVGEYTMLEGETNSITVDRENIWQTTFEEIKEIEDPVITFEVDFYSERAQDSGGPRREWLRLCNQKVSLIFSKPKLCAVPPKPMRTYFELCIYKQIFSLVDLCYLFPMNITTKAFKTLITGFFINQR